MANVTVAELNVTVAGLRTRVDEIRTDVHSGFANLDRKLDSVVGSVVSRELYQSERDAMRAEIRTLKAHDEKQEDRASANRRLSVSGLVLPVLVIIINLLLQAALR